MSNSININRLDNRSNLSYDPVDQSDPDRTRDEFLEEQERLEKRKEEYFKTNLFKSRIIDTEINASLIFQTILYFHFYYTIICFMIQFFSVVFKLWIFVPDNVAWTRLFLVPSFLLFEMIRINKGYSANLKEQVIIFIYNLIVFN